MPSPDTPTTRRLACLWLAHASLAAAISLVSAPPARAQPPHPDTTWQAARHAQAEGRWKEAFASLAALADQGHPAAARDALQLWREGRSFGPPPSDERLARWLRFSACGGHCSPEGWASASGC